MKEYRNKGGNKVAELIGIPFKIVGRLFKSALIKFAVLIAVCLASVVIAIAIFVRDPIGTVRGCYVFLQTKIAKK